MGMQKFPRSGASQERENFAEPEGGPVVGSFVPQLPGGLSTCSFSSFSQQKGKSRIFLMKKILISAIISEKAAKSEICYQKTQACVLFLSLMSCENQVIQTSVSQRHFLLTNFLVNHSLPSLFGPCLLEERSKAGSHYPEYLH
jgi:hypothetical protein